MKNKYIYIYVVIIIFIIIYILNFNIKNTIYKYRNDNISNKQVYIEFGSMLGGLAIFFILFTYFVYKKMKLTPDEFTQEQKQKSG